MGGLEMANGEIAVAENQQPPTLLHETNPVLILEESKAIANALADIIKEKKLYSTINGKDYVHVEGWTTLGALVKVFPILDWSKRLDREDGEVIYESRVIAQTLQGEIIGIGEALASGKETTPRGNPKWTDEYAIKSMSITRATSKALRIPLGWVMTLAGYSGTPFEEMDTFNNSNPNNKKPAPGKKSGSGRKPAPAKPAPATDEEAANDIVDAEFKVKDKKPKPAKKDKAQQVNMAPINVQELKGINDEFDKWINTVEDLEVTQDEAYNMAYELLGEQKLTPDDMKKVEETLGMDVK